MVCQLGDSVTCENMIKSPYMLLMMQKKANIDSYNVFCRKKKNEDS